jgi:hypothetical protein
VAVVVEVRLRCVDDDHDDGDLAEIRSGSDITAVLDWRVVILILEIPTHDIYRSK